jgi:hypothetical protein
MAVFSDNLYVGASENATPDAGGLYLYTPYGDGFITHHTGQTYPDLTITEEDWYNDLGDKWYHIADCETVGADYDCFPQKGTGHTILAMQVFDLKLWIGTDAGIWILDPDPGEDYFGDLLPSLYKFENFPEDIQVNDFIKDGETLVVLTKNNGIMLIK